MIDLWAVAANGLSVVGLALVLAVLGWGYWAAGVEGVRLGRVLGRPRLRRGIDVGLALFCAGLAGTSGQWWQRALWALLAAAWVVDGALAGRETGEGDGHGG